MIQCTEGGLTGVQQLISGLDPRSRLMWPWWTWHAALTSGDECEMLSLYLPLKQAVYFCNLCTFPSSVTYKFHQCTFCVRLSLTNWGLDLLGKVHLGVPAANAVMFHVCSDFSGFSARWISPWRTVSNSDARRLDFLRYPEPLTSALLMNTKNA